MKKLIFLLFPFLMLAQNPTNFPYGIKNTVAPSNSTPSYFVTQEVDGVHKKTPAANIENTANKQNSLAVDGTGVKYATVDAVNLEVVKLTGNQTVLDKKAFNKISVGTPTSDIIGHPTDSFNADLSIKGSGVRIENTTGESLIVNTTAYAGGSHFYDANVLAIQNKSTYLGSLSEVPSAIRFLSNTDGEMGAIGYQNGAVGTAFANSMFLAASMPYYPSNPIVAPTRLALIQEGDYLGALTKIERLEFNSDWSTKFKTPNGTTRLMIPVSGRVLVNTTTDNGVDDFQVNGIIKATTLKGNSLTSNLVLKATTNGQITNSTISDNGTNVGIGNNSTSPAENLEVRTTTNAGFAMTRNASTNAARFYFRTGSTYNWSVGIRSNRNDYSVYNEVLGVEPLTINSTTSNVLIGSTTDNAVDKLQVTGTASSGTTTLGNTPPTVNNQLTRKDYVDTGLALKADIASPTLTGTPTAPTATAGTNTTQIATTAFVQSAVAKRTFSITFSWATGSYAADAGVYYVNRESTAILTPTFSLGNATSGVPLPFNCKIIGITYSHNVLASTDLQMRVYKVVASTTIHTQVASKLISGNVNVYTPVTDYDTSATFNCATETVSIGFLNPTTTTATWRSPSITILFQEL